MGNVFKYFDCSTIHIKQESCDWLERYCSYKNEYGYVLSVYIMVIDELEYVPEEIKKVADLAKKHDCNYIIFDADGPICDKLDKYDWV